MIDREGKVAFKSGRGPYLFKPAELEHSLVLLLQEKPATGSQADAAAPAGGKHHPESPAVSSRASAPPAR